METLAIAILVVLLPVMFALGWISASILLESSK
jgi:hypothetical protein